MADKWEIVWSSQRSCTVECENFDGILLFWQMSQLGCLLGNQQLLVLIGCCMVWVLYWCRSTTQIAEVYYWSWWYDTVKPELPVACKFQPAGTLAQIQILDPHFCCHTCDCASVARSVFISELLLRGVIFTRCECMVVCDLWKRFIWKRNAPSRLEPNFTKTNLVAWQTHHPFDLFAFGLSVRDWDVCFCQSSGAW